MASSSKPSGKASTKASAPPATTAQRLGTVIKSARDIMRKDKGLNGELDRLPQLTWVLFLKMLDDVEKLREAEAVLEGTIADYAPVIAAPYRWRDWAANDEGISGDDLLRFISNDEVTLLDGTKCPGLLPYLRNLQSQTGRDRQDVIREVFKGISNRMDSGALLRDVVNKVNGIHFDKSEEVNILSTFYESMLKEMRDAAGDSGEFYTPRPVVRFMVRAMNPQVGDTIHDPACGTAGFLVEAYEHLKQQCQPKDWKLLRSSLSGVEAKSLPYMLAQMNLLLHGVEYPDVERRNSLSVPLNQIGLKDQVDAILTNPPFGGEEEESIKKNFPPDLQTAETALLFLQLIMRLLKRPQGKGKRAGRAGQAGVVVPNGTLFGDGVSAKIKQKLLTEYNLHTIVRLPNGVFSPYTSIPTNLLFFDASGPTQDIWYYEMPLPEGRKTYSKTKPMQDGEFAACLAWWHDRSENEQAWKYNFRAACDQAKAQAQAHWDAARAAEVKANQLAKQIKELDGPKQKSLVAQEREQRDVAKREQGLADGLYWPVYNLDQKNPNTKTDFEHLPPEQLVADIWQKEQRILEILGEIKDVLKAKPMGDV